MRADVQLTTRFLTTQSAHQVGLLVTVAGEAPVQRPPINVALVLDRSGSMAGMPLDAAREAAHRFAGFLAPTDRLTVVTFDDRVHTIFGPAAAGDPAATDAIARVQAGGSTNLSGGWLMGRRHVCSGLVDGTNRVVLLTDGLANAGITSVPELVGLSAEASAQRVSTTCIGFGSGFNEDLLEPMARQGGGNYWYVETAEQMAPIFDAEIEGLVALVAQNVTVEVSLTHPGVAGVSFLQSYAVDTSRDGAWRVVLGDVYATSPRPLGAIFHVDSVAALGTVTLGEVRIEADVVQDAGIVHRTITLPVVANLDASDHVEPVVEEVLLRFRAARAREEAIRCADDGDFDRAAAALRDGALNLMPYASSPCVAEEIRDLKGQAALLASRRYGAADRKYDAAMAMGMREGKDAYLHRMRRPPRA